VAAKPLADDRPPGWFDRVYPPSLREAEANAVVYRRTAARVGDGHHVGLGENGLPRNTVGLALSGGGIRSATFCLGFLQSLASHKLLRSVDLLSTVSGGGYIGGFLGRLFSRPWLNAPANEPTDSTSPPCPADRSMPPDIAAIVGDADGAARVEKILADPASPPISRLRENGRYLAPNGAGDVLLAAAVFLRNLVAVHVVLASFVLMLLLAVNLGRAWLAGLLTTSCSWSWLAGFLTRGTVGPLLWWSPLFMLPILLFVVWSVPLGWSYWLTQREDRGHFPVAVSAAVALGASGGAVAWYLSKGRPQHLDFLASRPITFAAIALVAVLALGYWGLSCSLSRNYTGLARTNAERRRLSNWLKTSLVCVGALVTLGFLDSLGQTTYAAIQWQGLRETLLRPSTLPPLGLVIGLIAFGKKAVTFINELVGSKRVKPSLEILAWLPAIVAMCLGVVALSAAVHGLSWGWGVPVGSPALVLASPPAPTVALGQANQIIVNAARPAWPSSMFEKPKAHMSVSACAKWLALAVLLCWCFGRISEFLNLSSHHSLYAARLTRAYLGASNPDRWHGKGRDVTEPIECDSVDLNEYAPHKNGGPLHVINVTVNETVSGRSNIERRDRKGLPMALGPCGVSVGSRHHALWRPEIPPKKSLWWHADRYITGLFGPIPVARSVWRGTKAATLAVWDSAPFRFTRPAQPEEAEATGTAPTPPPPGQSARPALPLQPGRRIVPMSPDAGRFHPLFENGDSNDQFEPLDLGRWLAISGAAFTTGLGFRTSMALSFLAGLANVRLGYWWNSGVEPTSRPGAAGDDPPRKGGLVFSALFSVQSYLLDEFLARFHGPARRRWYLSDGGHFENTGLYELIRRRVPVIVCCDCGADPTYSFGDIAGIVLKARTDFDAEIEFPDESIGATPVARPPFGLLADLRQKPKQDGADLGYSGAHATLACVYYRDGLKRRTHPDSVILFIKPSLTSALPRDVLNYAYSHAAFPQESTADQFFDEAQWESYRKLGQHIGDVCFSNENWQDFRILHRLVGEAWPGFQRAMEILSTGSSGSTEDGVGI